VSGRQEQQQISHTNWVQSLGEARNTCRKALARASVDVSDPERALWPAVPRSQMTREHKTVAKTHASVLDYAEHIEPYSERCIEPWTRQIATFEFPDGEELDICLSEIEQWADLRFEQKTTAKDELCGRKEDYEHRRVHLPTMYSRECFRLLNKCLGELHLAADLKTPDHGAIGPDNAL